MIDRLQDRFDFDTEDTISSIRDRYDDARKRFMRALPKERQRRERRARIVAFAGGVAVGALAAFLLDPLLGRTRRARLADQAVARYGTEGYDANDVTLARKVESELLGRPDVPKGSVLVNVEQGRVVLRGRVDRPELRDDLTRLVLATDGVDEVENLVHLPGESSETTEEVRRLAR